MNKLQHDKVAAHYNRIRYPRYPWVFWGRWRDLSRIDLSTWGATRKIEKAWLCGAGTIQPLLFGRRNSQVRFLATDLSARSLKESRIRCGLHGVLNVEFRTQDLFRCNAIEEFDAIDAYGVLHHTEDPKKGLEILARALKPGGVIRLMLYSREARQYLEDLRSELLAEKENWTDAQLVQFLRERKIPFLGDLESKAGRADALLHPLVTTYNEVEARKLAISCGLQILRHDQDGKHILFLKK